MRGTVVDEQDANRWRWQTSLQWQVVQSAWTSDAVGHRDHTRRVPESDEHLVIQSRGCLVSSVALRFAGNRDISAAMQSIVDDVVYKLGDDDFINDVEQRLFEYGLDDYTDTALSTLYRSQRMALGGGS